MKYIWQQASWPTLRWDSEALLPLVSHARLAQGKLLAKVARLGFKLNREAQAEILTEEALTTSAIEGERLNRDSVRSSVARHLGLPAAGLAPATRSVDGLVDVLLDATQRYDAPLTAARLKRWQAALFPAGYSGLKKIRPGQWRGSQQTMQVVSGAVGRERVHYEAPPGPRVAREMARFLAWWKASAAREDGMLRAGLAHLYFVTIHPFEDGNGRIARAVTEMAVAQDERLPTRYYSLSSQIMAERREYYRALETCQKGGGDVTRWLQWHVACYTRAVARAERLIADVLAKATFWQDHSQVTLNDRQRKVLNRLLDAGRGGFQGGLTTRKYVGMTKVSRATAFREIAELVDKGLLVQNPARGRSASYNIKWRPPCTD